MLYTILYTLQNYFYLKKCKRKFSISPIISQPTKDLSKKGFEKNVYTLCELVISTKLGIDFVFGFTVYIPQQKAETDSPNLNVEYSLF